MFKHSQSMQDNMELDFWLADLDRASKKNQNIQLNDQRVKRNLEINNSCRYLGVEENRSTKYSYLELSSSHWHSSYTSCRIRLNSLFVEDRLHSYELQSPKVPHNSPSHPVVDIESCIICYTLRGKKGYLNGFYLNGFYKRLTLVNFFFFFFLAYSIFHWSSNNFYLTVTKI